MEEIERIDGVRNPRQLVFEIKKLIPEDNSFYKDVDWYINDFFYKPPEMWVECFYRFAFQVIEPMIGPPPIIEDWKIKIIAIWLDESEDSIREKFSKQ